MLSFALIHVLMCVNHSNLLGMNFMYDLEVPQRVSMALLGFSGPVELLCTTNSLITAPFENGIWKIHVELPEQYPYKSPSIGFVNKIFHPNIDELSGSVCLDVINQTWSPMFDMINIFEVFLPQLLRYPNPSDPLNGDASSLLMKDPKGYYAKVREYVSKYATVESFKDNQDSSDSGDEMSSVGSYDSDEEAAGTMEV